MSFFSFLDGTIFYATIQGTDNEFANDDKFYIQWTRTAGKLSDQIYRIKVNL